MTRLREEACNLDTEGLNAAGLKVRRTAPTPPLEEALSLAEVLGTWNLRAYLMLDSWQSLLAEVGTQPTWVCLMEVRGRRTGGGVLLPSHPLSETGLGEPVRLLAVVSEIVLGTLVEASGRRRIIWLRQ